MRSMIRLWGGLTLTMLGVLIISTQTFAAEVTTFGAMATRITGSFAGIVKLITAGSYLAGIGFALGAIMKFKQHKDNPTQIPIGTPISMSFIAAALLFFPVVLNMAGITIFGTTKTAGTGGTVWGPSAGGSTSP